MYLLVQRALQALAKMLETHKKGSRNPEANAVQRFDHRIGKSIASDETEIISVWLELQEE